MSQGCQELVFAPIGVAQRGIAFAQRLSRRNFSTASQVRSATILTKVISRSLHSWASLVATTSAETRLPSRSSGREHQGRDARILGRLCNVLCRALVAVDVGDRDDLT